MRGSRLRHERAAPYRDRPRHVEQLRFWRHQHIADLQAGLGRHSAKEGGHMTRMPLLMGVTLTMLAMLAGPVAARDDRIMLAIRDALDGPDAKAKLDRGVRLHFGGGFGGPVAKDLGVWKSNKKANAFLKDDKVACERAFLSAVISLQERARKMGGNAVVNIASN